MKYAIHTNAAVNSSKINSVLEDYQRNCSESGCSEESIGHAHATYKIHFTTDPYYISKYSMFECENLANHMEAKPCKCFSLWCYECLKSSKVASCIYVVSLRFLNILYYFQKCST